MHILEKGLSIGGAVLFLAWVLGAPAFAQNIEIASSPNPVGSGARAIGMGGAFIAVADDATAASWNPGGLIQLETPEMSVVGSYYVRREEYVSDIHPETAGDNEMDSTNLNYLSAAYPFVAFGRNLVASVNYQHMYDFNKSIELDYNWALSGGTLFDRVDYRQDGGLWAVSPALAVQLSPAFSFGLTLNFWEDFIDDNRWTTDYRSAPGGIVGGNRVDMALAIRNDFSFSGFNMHFGFLWAINHTFTLGGVYKTAFDADVRRKFRFFESQSFPDLPPEFSTTSLVEREENLELRMPRSYGVGFAVRFSDAFTMDVDVYRTEWGRFALVDEDGNETSPVTGQPRAGSDVGTTHQVRIGAEYLFILENAIIPVRGGLFYDPEPASHSPEDYYGFSLGSGFVGKTLAVDAAYQFRRGSGVEGDVIGVPGTEADVSQHLLLVSAIYHF